MFELSLQNDALGLGNLVGSFWTGQQIDSNQEIAESQIQAQKEIAKEQNKMYLMIAAGLLLIIFIFIILKYA